MKTKDFELLKSLVGDKFEVKWESPEDNDKIWVVKKKDPWDGVEFVESGFDGTIYQIISQNDDLIIIRNGEIDKKSGNPSTESAYVEQLKRIAFEKLGEIKVGDRFDRTTIRPHWGNNIQITESGDGSFDFWYNKKDDQFFIGNYCIYEKGKWAERVKDRVEISYSVTSGVLVMFLKNGEPYRPHWREMDFLREQLENYLNDGKNQRPES